MNEAETRAEHIDPALAAAGWGVVDGTRIRREYQITLGRLEGRCRRGRAHTADYVLIFRNRKLAVVEASRVVRPVISRTHQHGKEALAERARTRGLRTLDGTIQ